jgi:hypothetical protein
LADIVIVVPDTLEMVVPAAIEAPNSLNPVAPVAGGVGLTLVIVFVPEVKVPV